MNQQTPSEIFSLRLREARQLRQLNQNELANRTGLPPSSIAHFERNSRKPSFDTLRKLAKALDVSTDYLIGMADDPVNATSGDPLFRDIGKLTDQDRRVAKDFLEFLAKRGRGDL